MHLGVTERKAFIRKEMDQICVFERASGCFGEDGLVGEQRLGEWKYVWSEKEKGPKRSKESWETGDRQIGVQDGFSQ